MVILLSALAGSADSAPDSPPETALADYVMAPDDSYDWRLVAQHSVSRAQIVRLQLQSQTWRGRPWKHWLFLIRPESLRADSRRAVLVIAGGNWEEDFETEIDAELPEDTELFVEIANRLGSYMAVLGQVPYQPLFDMTEDNLIAYSFERYLATGDAEWPLLLPMVKSAVRAMDATQDFTATEWDAGLEEFTVLGGSKRGWTTWLTGVVDSRATVLVPLAIDALNFSAHMPYQTSVWGAPSEELAPYSERGLIEVLASPVDARLRTIVDPYTYRGSLAQPKLIVVPTNDAYFPLDAMNLYWNELPGPKYALYLPNEGHSIEDFERLIPAIDAVHRSADGEAGLPALTWQFQDRDDGLRICLRADPAPAFVTAWIARSEDTDFRDAEFIAEPVPARDGLYLYHLSLPDTGFSAAFLEGVFVHGGGQFSLSSNVRIVDAAGGAPHSVTAISGAEAVCPPG